MRVVFLGSPEPVLPVLTALKACHDGGKHQLVGVVSQPARPTGRGQRLMNSPVSRWAEEHNIPLLRPERARDSDFLAAFGALKPDVAVTAAYGQILSEAFLTVPRRATINIHPSLLPRHRGATPVPAALLAGETVSGVTVLFTVKALDAGNIILQESSPIGPLETAGALTLRLFELGATLLPKALSILEVADFQGSPQDPAAVTHCRKISKNDGAMDFTLPARVLFDRWRAFEPWPGSYTFQDGRRLSIPTLRIIDEENRSLSPGEVVFDKAGNVLFVGTGAGRVAMTHVKPAGKGKIDAGSFWNGLRERGRVRFSNDESEQVAP